MRYYIAGPMTGYANNNFPAFEAAAEALKADGHESMAIRRDFEAIMQADGVFMLRGWEKSVGARAEHALAVWRGIDVQYQ